MSEYEKVRKHINSDEIAKLTFEFVRIPSPTGQELEMAKFYARTLEELGLDVTLEYVEENRPNVIAKLPGEGAGPNLMFCGHLDTVPIGECVSPRIDGERVYGRGSCDMKGSHAAVIQAIKAMVQSQNKLKGDVYVAGCVGHESPVGSGEGVKALAREIREGRLEVTAVINMEGPMDSIKVAQGGASMFAISVANKDGNQYSATSSFSSNPVLWTGDVIRQLQRIDKSLSVKKRHPLILQRPTVQVGLIEGGDFLFSVPSEVKLEGIIRWDPDEDFVMVSRRFEATFERLQRQMRDKYGQSLQLSVTMRLDRESCEVPEGMITASLARALKMVTGQKAKLIGTRWVSDLGILYRDGRVPAIEYGPFLPPDISLAHTDRESIAISNLETVSRVYAAVMLDFCEVAS